MVTSPGTVLRLHSFNTEFVDISNFVGKREMDWVREKSGSPDSDLEDLEQLDSFQMNWLKQNSAPKATKAEAKKRKRFNPLLKLNELEFRHKYRFSKNNMHRIIDMVRDDLEVDNYTESRGNQVPVKLQIMAAIRCWGLTEHSEVTAMSHEISNRTLNKICRRVSAALASKASRYIRMPATLAEKEQVTNAFQSLAHMPQVIGALSHLSVRLMRNLAEPERNHGTESAEDRVYIQIVSDASLKIRDIDCKLRAFGEENSAIEMFAQSRIKERFEQNEFRGRVLVGDTRLSCSPFLYTPVQWPSTPRDQSFNRSHAGTLATVNHCMNLWQRRFGILDSKVCGSYSTVRQTIVALALLHNMAIDWNDLRDCSVHTYGYDLMDPFSWKSVPGMPINQDEYARSEFIKNNF